MPDDALPTVTPELRALRERYAAFMEEHVYPNERAFAADDDTSDALIATLRGRAQAAGLWAPHIGPEAGGTGLGFLSYAFLNEVIGRSYWGQLVFGCQAPDAGNSEILHTFATPEQRREWLAPLVAGDVRSFFGMTEPEVSGADPTGLECRASRDGGDWVIDGHKWFSTGADGSAFGIVMAVTDPEDAPHRHMSMIIVPTGAPGVEVVRNIEVFGHARPRLELALRGALRRTCASRPRTCSESAAPASRSHSSGSGPAASTTPCAGSVRCSARST